MCELPVTNCFLKLGYVGRIIFLFFEIILDLPEALFIKTEQVIITCSKGHFNRQSLKAVVRS